MSENTSKAGYAGQIADGTLIEVLCKECAWCGNASTVLVKATEYRAFQEGALIQNAFPTTAASVREMLLTGTHQKCWDEMFGDDE